MNFNVVESCTGLNCTYLVNTVLIPHLKSLESLFSDAFYKKFTCLNDVPPTTQPFLSTYQNLVKWGTIPESDVAVFDADTIQNQTKLRHIFKFQAVVFQIANAYKAALYISSRMNENDVTKPTFIESVCGSIPVDPLPTEDANKKFTYDTATNLNSWAATMTNSENKYKFPGAYTVINTKKDSILAEYGISPATAFDTAEKMEKEMNKDTVQLIKAKKNVIRRIIMGEEGKQVAMDVLKGNSADTTPSDENIKNLQKKAADHFAQQYEAYISIDSDKLKKKVAEIK